MRRHALAAIVVCFFTMPGPTSADELLRNIPPGEKPVEVLIGFNLVNITDVSEKEETIDFDGALYMKWTDPRQSYNPADYGMSPNWKPGDYSQAPGRIYFGLYGVEEEFTGWRPRISMPNGIGDRTITNVAISIWPDGRVAYSESFYAKAETPMDLRRFPFDTQHLEVFFHPFVYHRDEIVLVPDDRLARTWNQNLGIADWSRELVTMQERPVDIAFFDETRSVVSEFIVTVSIKRRPVHMLISIIFPMVLLVSLTWSVFWMDNEALSNRVNINFIGILSVVAYYFVILENVPEVSYLTLMDAFITSTFLILAAGVILVVWVESLAEDVKVSLGPKVDRTCRWAFPLAYVLLAIILGTVFFNVY